MNVQAVYTVVVLAIAASAISMTVSKSGVSAPAREWVRKRSSWLGDLLDCPYCMSHWIALAAVALYQPRLLASRLWLVDLLVDLFVVVALASIVSGWIFRAFAPMPGPPDDQSD